MAPYLGQRQSELRAESREQERTGANRGQRGQRSRAGRAGRCPWHPLCLLQAGDGLGRRREPIFNLRVPASGVKFRERPGQLSAEAARGKLLLLGELLLSLVKV